MLTTYISQPEIICKLTSSQSLPSPPFGTTERLSPGLWSSVRPGIKLKLITPVFSLLGFFFFFLVFHMACVILIPRSGIEPGPSTMKAWSPYY